MVSDRDGCCCGSLAYASVGSVVQLIRTNEAGSEWSGYFPEGMGTYMPLDVLLGELGFAPTIAPPPQPAGYMVAWLAARQQAVA